MKLRVVLVLVLACGAGGLSVLTGSADPAQPSAVQPGVVQPGVAQPGVVQPGVAQLGVAQPGDAEWSDLKLWYRQPAEAWNEALPVGNGKLGAMVFGRTGQERIQFNEETLWSGGPYDPSRDGGAEALPEIRATWERFPDSTDPVLELEEAWDEENLVRG